MKKKLVILIILFFFQGIFTNMHHPLMPYYVNSLALPQYMFGFYFAFMNLGIMIGGPFWGNLGDQGKKKLVVIIGYLIYGVNQALFGMGDVFGQWTLSVFRLLSGFGIAAATTIITSEIILLSDSKNRGRNITYGAAAVALGGSVGFFFGGFIHTNEFVINLLNTDNFFNALLLQCLLNVGLAIAFFFLYKPVEVEVKKERKRAQFWEGFSEIKNLNLEMFFFLMSLTFITFAATNIDKYLDVYFSDLNYLADTLGNYKMVVGLVSIVATIVLVPLLIKVKKRLLLIGVFQVLSALIVVITFRFSNGNFMLFLYTVFMLYIIIKALYAPLEQEYIAARADQDKIATTMGIRQSFYSIGTILGPIAGAFIYAYNKILLFDISAIFLLLSVVFLVLTFLARKNGHAKEAELIPFVK